MKVSEVLAQLRREGIGNEKPGQLTENGMVQGWSDNPVFSHLSLMPPDEEVTHPEQLIEEAHYCEAEVESLTHDADGAAR